ncbi:PREDICTED: uncharacterized protein LOC106804816 [Priapulus caudatus]|uniref:Uncharacterized protein LOC106804816 n=1 Tax=Priapulus caudatus TaxID=37621 RepID=A0ABM1DNX6_PRICU|nr:PREDICTED: uncharacterized protein LOC106804816 [Priapulus caudatus]
MQVKLCITVALLAFIVQPSQQASFFDRLAGNGPTIAQDAPADTCADEPCHNGGSCSEDGVGYECACPENVAGKTCEDTAARDRINKIRNFKASVVQNVHAQTDDFSIDANPNANEDVDIILIVDRSLSVGQPSFEQAKCALKEWVQLFQDDLTIQARVMILSYGREVILHGNFTAYRSVEEVNYAIDDIAYRYHSDLCRDQNDNCATCTNLALAEAYDRFIDESSNSRPDATRAVVLITDGRSNCPGTKETCLVAGNLKADLNVDVFVQAVGQRIDADEIMCIATEGNFNLQPDYEGTCQETGRARELDTVHP